MNYGYIYLTTNLVNRKIYVGQHSKKEFDTKYKGSGNAILSAIKKYGWNSFSCEILCWCENGIELDEMEKFWIAELNSNIKDIGYNLCDGGQGIHGYHHKEESKIKISKNNARYWKGKRLHPNTLKASREYHMAHKSALIGRKVPRESVLKSVEGRRRHIELYGNKNKGRIVSQETRLKLRESHLCQIPWNKGRKNIYKEETKIKISNGLKKYYSTHEGARTGKYFLEESKKKISESVSKANQGKKFINNGIINKFQDAEICEKLISTGEWKYGRLSSQKFKDANKDDFKGRIWVTNGIENKFINKTELDEYLSKGYYKGVIRKTYVMSEEGKKTLSENGKKAKGKVLVNKDGKWIRIDKSELNNYLDNGWERGTGCHGKR